MAAQVEVEEPQVDKTPIQIVELDAVKIRLEGPKEFIRKFLAWRVREGVYSTGLGGGGGSPGARWHVAYYSQEDAERVRQWVAQERKSLAYSPAARGEGEVSP